MKAMFRLTSMSLLTILILVSYSCRPKTDPAELGPPANTRVVILKVDTDNIPMTDSDTLDLSKYCSFIGQQTETKSALENYETGVNKGDQVVWIALSKSNKDSMVEIFLIEVPDGEINVLRRNSIQAQNKNVIARVRKIGINTDEITKYILKFKVTKDNKEMVFTIDPKLRVI